MELYCYDAGIPLADLVRDAERAVAGWDWRRGAFGHALPLTTYGELHPYARYGYQNFPSTGLLARCPAFRALFESLRCDKVSFRLLRRPPASAYGWHTDRWKGPGVVRFQIPLVSDSAAFLVLTDYTSEAEVVGPRVLSAEAFPAFAAANAGRFRQYHLARGRLCHFDTSHVHTLVNPARTERITLSFDLVVNEWVRAHFPEVRVELGDGPVEPLPRPGPMRRGLAFLGMGLHPVRSRARRWLGRDAGEK